jgi:hypothetical protein
MKNIYNQVKHLPNVVSVGRGYKYVGGSKTSEISAVVGVSKKVSNVYLLTSEIIPKQLNGLRSDVVEIGTVRAFELTSKVRPLQLGYSVGHPAITAGTIGGIVICNGKPAILSNNHVLANSNAATIGDDSMQPGPYDQTEPGDYVIGQLYDFKEIGFVSDIPTECNIGQAFVFLSNAILAYLGRKTRLAAVQAAEIFNKVDAAVAILNDGVGFDPACAIKKIIRAGIGDRVFKVGRTTERTEGTIDQIDVTLQVQYGAGQIAVFDDQMLSESLYSQPGDSGSGIRSMNDEYCLKGLLFAGSDTVTIGCQPDNVQSALNFQLIGDL